MLLGTLGAGLLGNILTGKGIYRAGKRKGIVRAGYGRPLLLKIVVIIKWIFNTALSFN